MNIKMIFVVGTFLAFAACKDKPKEVVGAHEIPITTSSKEALEEYLIGRDLSDQLRGLESKPHFENAIAKDTNFALAYYELANAALTNQEYLDRANQASELANRASEGEQWLIMAQQAGIVNNTNEQKEIFNLLVAKYPKDKRAHLNYALFFQGLREDQAAIDEYKKALAIDSNFALCYNSLGYVYINTGNLSEAEAAFRKYIELMPNESNPYDSYAELLLKEGKFDEAIKNYEKAVSLNAKFYDSHNALGYCYLFQNRFDDARKRFQKLYDVSADAGFQQMALAGIRNSYICEGKLDTALEKEKRIYAMVEKSIDALSMQSSLNVMGDIYLEMNKPEEATVNYKKAVQAATRSRLSNELKENAQRLFLMNEAMVAIKKNDSKTANVKLEAYRKMAETAGVPRQPIHRLAGFVAFLEKKYDLALEELKQADDQDSRVLFKMYEVYTAKGDKSKADEMRANLAGLNQISYQYMYLRNKAMGRDAR